MAFRRFSKAIYFGHHEKLVVVIDGKYDLTELISKALKHVGFQCRGITKEVLFYIDINPVEWHSIWKIFEPSFQVLKNQQNLKIDLFFSQSKNNTASNNNQTENDLFNSSFFTSTATKTIRKIEVCPMCKKKPATERRVG
ncbi:hypothetical protein CN481_20155 [Bacillus sp. AFS006103]|nr:hypothetical protein CN481_20155 [Bacillus sp. AFS006103]